MIPRLGAWQGTDFCSSWGGAGLRFVGRATISGPFRQLLEPKPTTKHPPTTLKCRFPEKPQIRRETHLPGHHPHPAALLG